MVEIEITKSAVKATKGAVNETKHAIEEATSESNQDAATQASMEMERTAKKVLSVGRSMLGWESGSSSKMKNVIEDVEI